MSSTPVLNPITGELPFAIIPALTLAGLACPESPVHLPVGRHVGPNRGFGVQHIWAEHRAEILRAGHSTETDVPLYVLDMLRSGTPLFFEGQNWRTTRLMAVRSSSGTVVMEFRAQRQGSIWAVVTAFSGTKTHGTRVGTVR